MIKCSHCGSNNFVKHGFERTKNGKVQRYFCDGCNKHFTE